MRERTNKSLESVSLHYSPPNNMIVDVASNSSASTAMRYRQIKELRSGSDVNAAKRDGLR